MRKKLTTAFWASTILSSATVATAAQAQSDTSDIIVTARRTEERLQDVPISITVFNQTQLANNNVVNAQDLAANTPSLSANSNFGNQNSSFALRGFVQENGTAPSVGVYFADVVAPRGASNGIPVGDGAGPGSFFDLQNVQILKGPQGTLFGRNTTGGAVLLVPQKPTGRFEGFVEGSYGNYDMQRVQGVVNIPVMDTLRIRLGIDRQTREGFLYNNSGIGPKDFNDVDYTAVRASIVADLTPNLENYTIISYSNSRTNGALNPISAAAAGGLGDLALAQLARQGSDFYTTQQSLPNPFGTLKQWQIVNTTTWRASDLVTIKNIASYAQLRNVQNAPLFGTNFVLDLRLAGAGVYNVPFSTVTSPPGLATGDQSTFTEELQFQGRSADDRLQWQAGGYLEISEPLGGSGAQSSFLAPCVDLAKFQCSDPVGYGTYLGAVGAVLAGGGDPSTVPLIHVGTVNYTVGRTAFRNVGTYAQATYKFSDLFKLTAGLRYTWDRQSNVSDQRTYTLLYPPANGLFPAAALTPPANPRCTNPQANATGCISNYYLTSNKPTWLIDIDVTPMPDVLLYAKYVRGYRAGTIVPNISAPLNYVLPEKVDTYEIGLKTSFGGAVRGTFNMAAFYNDFSNQQLQVGFNAKPTSGQSSTSAPVNAGKSEIYGVEIDASLNPFEGLSLQAGYTYLKTKLKSVPDFSGISDPNYDLSAPFKVGDPLTLSPKNKITISGTYTLPLNESIGKISVGATFTHRDSNLVNYSDRANPNSAIAALSYLPPLDLLNLNASWNGIAGIPVDLSVFATNVTKQKYYTYQSSLGGSTFLNFETGVVGEPRMYGARLRYRFGG